MKRALLTRERVRARLTAMQSLKPVAALVLIGSLSGCVQVAAPDKPIEINLNINIRQEVVVRLQQDVRELIQKNPGVF